MKQKILNKNKIKKNNGITLIALVITIIVLLILAGVSIATLTGQNGILTQATQSKEKTQIASEEELRKLTQLEATTNLEDYNYTDISGKKINIPAHCAISQVEGENTLAEGLVIIDANGNEWVWIEVPKAMVFTTAKNNTEYDAIESDLIAYVGDYRKGSNEQNCNCVDEWYDADGNIINESSNSNDTSGCGLTSLQYTLLYKKMLSSIFTNEGFWVGRYEAGISKTVPRTEGKEITETAKSQKDMYPYTYITCSQAQKLASNMSPDNSKTSSLMFGIQWDLVCKYLESSKALNKDDINSDSDNWGNYANASFTVSSGKYAVLDQNLNELQNWSTVNLNYEKTSSGTENKVLFTTGVTKRNSKMNIYDMAGNTVEWTLEHYIGKYKDSPSVFRGGSYAHNSFERPVAYRGCTTAIYSNFGYSFRSSLY